MTSTQIENIHVSKFAMRSGVSHHLVEEEIPILTLYENGTICECNQAAAELLGCRPDVLTWLHVSNVMPQLTESTLMQGEKINPNLRFLSHIGYGFEVIGFSGIHFACALFFNEVESFLVSTVYVLCSGQLCKKM